MTANASPVIDIRAFENGDAKTRQIIAEQVDAICQSTGFLAITNHGISAQTTTNLESDDRQLLADLNPILFAINYSFLDQPGLHKRLLP